MAGGGANSSSTRQGCSELRTVRLDDPGAIEFSGELPLRCELPLPSRHWLNKARIEFSCCFGSDLITLLSNDSCKTLLGIATR